MEKYKFAYIVEVTAKLPTDDKELVKQAEEETGVKVTYDSLRTDMGEIIVECLEDLADEIDIAVSPVKHGRWIDKTTWFGSIGKCCYECSECGYQIPYKPQSRGDGKGSKYCDECGARMDGGEE